MSRIFTIMSGKGGVGKTTLSAALALYYARQGMKCTLLDGDIGLRCADLTLNMQDQVIYDLGDLCAAQCTLEQALIRCPDAPCLSLLAAPQLMKASEFKSRDIAAVVRRVAAGQDIVLLDAPAGVGRGLKNLLGAESSPVIVATPDDVSLRDAERLGMLLTERGEPHPGIIFNRVNRELVRRGKMMPPQALATAVDMPLLGIVPESPLIYQALLSHKNPLDCGDPQVVAAIGNIASRLLGADIPLPEYRPSALLRFFSKGGNRP